MNQSSWQILTETFLSETQNSLFDKQFENSILNYDLNLNYFRNPAMGFDSFDKKCVILPAGRIESHNNKQRINLFPFAWKSFPNPAKSQSPSLSKKIRGTKRVLLEKWANKRKIGWNLIKKPLCWTQQNQKIYAGKKQSFSGAAEESLDGKNPLKIITLTIFSSYFRNNKTSIRKVINTYNFFLCYIDYPFKAMISLIFWYNFSRPW